MDAAEQVITRAGVRQASVAAICAASGLPVGSLYHHFGNKAGLVAAVLERGSTRFFEAMPPNVDEERSALDNLRRHWRAAADVIAANLPHFLLTEDLDEPGSTAESFHGVVRDLRRQQQRQLTGLLEPAAREAGAPQPAQLAEQLAAVTVVYIRGVIAETRGELGPMRELLDVMLPLVEARIHAAAASSRPPGAD